MRAVAIFTDRDSKREVLRIEIKTFNKSFSSIENLEKDIKTNCDIIGPLINHGPLYGVLDIIWHIDFYFIDQYEFIERTFSGSSIFSTIEKANDFLEENSSFNMVGSSINCAQYIK